MCESPMYSIALRSTSEFVKIKTDLNVFITCYVLLLITTVYLSCLFVLVVGASPGFIGSGETDQSGHGVSGGRNTERKTESGQRTAHSEGRERQTGS